MKLEELRKLYVVHELPKEPKMEVITGFDPAVGPDSAVPVLRCATCDLVMTITCAREKIVRAYCPSCDVGCSMCKQLRDADGNKLRILETGIEKRRVCGQCRYDYYDVLTGKFRTEKWPPDEA